MNKDKTSKNLLFEPYMYPELPEHHEEYYLDFENFFKVSQLIDDWGLLYNGMVKIDERKYIYKLRESVFRMDKKKHMNYLNKIARQKARAIFFDELKNQQIKNMSDNVKFVAEILLKTGNASLVL